MKKIISLFLISTVILSLVAIGTAQTSSNHKRVFVYFKDFPTGEDLKGIEVIGGAIKFEYRDMPVISIEIPENAIPALLKNPRIEKIEDVLIVQLELKPEAKPTRPQPNQQMPWGISRINALDAWAQSRGSGVYVAVLDTGVDRDHPDLAGNLAWCKSYIAKNCEDKDGHGTHVAGTILAIDNSIGVVGVAPLAKLYALQICSTAGCYIDAATKAIEDARYGPDGKLETSDDNAKVISMSWGGYSLLGSAFETQIRNAYSEGIVLVASAGNNGISNSHYPSGYAEVISVGATDSNNKLASWSNFGPDQELVAPGVDILSTYKGDWYAYGLGTSMAAPHVSGTVALMLAKNPGLTPDQVRDKLHSTATDLGTSDWDQNYGYGLVNAASAVN